MWKAECDDHQKLMKQLGGNKKEQIISTTPKGHFVVYVGPELKRFAVPMSYLKKPYFQQLLQESAELYGFRHNHHKGIVLPCHESTFQMVMELEIEKS